MKNYLDLCQDILDNGVYRPDRTCTGTISVFGRQLRFDLQQGFPLVTTKRVFHRGALAEMLWMISGSSNIKPLVEQNVHIWDEWADEDGELGPVYGVQWRNWLNCRWDGAILHAERFNGIGQPNGIDQLGETIANLSRDPFSRRHLVTAWNPAELPEMKLPPCHYAYQFYVRPVCEHSEHTEYFLDCMVQMRSVDVFLGLPFDIAGYAFLTHMVAKLTGYIPGDLVFNLGDTHIYMNHLQQVGLQLTREPRPLPQLKIINTGQQSIDDFKLTHFMLLDYDPHPPIKGDVSV